MKTCLMNWNRGSWNGVLVWNSNWMRYQLWCEISICVLSENSIREIPNNTPTVTYLLEHRSLSLHGGAMGLLSHSLLPRGVNLVWGRGKCAPETPLWWPQKQLHNLGMCISNTILQVSYLLPGAAGNMIWTTPSSSLYVIIIIDWQYTWVVHCFNLPCIVGNCCRRHRYFVLIWTIWYWQYLVMTSMIKWQSI